MSDERDPVDASLRRLFAPPDLGGLQAKIAAAAAAAALAPVEPQREASPRRRRVWGTTIAATAAAAAAALLLSTRVQHSAAVFEPAADPIVAPVFGPREQAGAQLARFYVSGTALARLDDADCLGAPPIPEACDGSAPEPRLAPSDALEVIGECGALGGPTCDGYDLPAARLVQLRVRPQGPRLLVCVEPRDADPRPLLPDDSGLQLFRRELGAFILYEVTPLSDSLALELFSL